MSQAHYTTPTLPIATVQGFHDDVEARPDNPARTEPLTVGAAFPDGYEPHVYEWTAVLPLQVTDAEGNVVPILNAPSATLAIPRGQYGVGWVENIISQLSPGMVYSETNWSQLRYYTEPLPMAEGLELATRVEGFWGSSQSDVVRVPRPLEGEAADETATYVVLAVASQNQQSQIQGQDPSIRWFDSLPDVPAQLRERIAHAVWDSAQGVVSDAGSVTAWQPETGEADNEWLSVTGGITFPGSRFGRHYGVRFAEPASALHTLSLVQHTDDNFLRFLVLRSHGEGSFLWQDSEATALHVDGSVLRHVRMGVEHVAGAVPTDRLTLVMVGYHDGASICRAPGAHAESHLPLPALPESWVPSISKLEALGGAYEIVAAHHYAAMPDGTERESLWEAIRGHYGVIE